MADKKNQKAYLNLFFVEVFNKILIAEENFLNSSAYNNLSVKEIHILEQVALLQLQKKNTMGTIARNIGITVGALTTAINTLNNKGYLIRERIDHDRRVVKIYLTELGESANKEHEKFHEEMIEGIVSVINNNELNTLLFSLEQLKIFFGQYLSHI